MLYRVRRPVASLVICLLGFTSCHRVERRPSAGTIATKPDGNTQEKIVGVTMADGRDVRFDRNWPVSVRGDSLHATTRGGQPVAVPVASVQRVWIRKIDPTRTTFAVIGVTVGVAVGALAAAFAASCPFVYSWDGTQYVFDAEPYGGAITRGLERDDYSNLEMLRPDSAGRYRLLVTNEVDETQYTNSMRLLVVDHRPEQRFEMDEWGALHAVSRAVPPSSARDQEGRDLVPWLAATDQLIWEPLPPASSAGSMRQEIVLTFPRPRGVTSARFVARANTGAWGSQMIRELLTLRGSAVKDWYAAIDGDRASADLLRAWNIREELYVLKLDVEEAGTWQTRGLLPGGGIVADSRVVSLDLSRVTGDSVRIRIRPPSGFWALNSFAMTYEERDRPIGVDTIAPMTAVTSDGRDLLGDLRSDDDRYYAMPTTSDRAELTFQAPPARPGAVRSIFLHTRGYYRLNMPETGAPNVAALQQITDQPDGAARLSADIFAKRRVARTP